ncbi:hypothetical protein AB0K48_36315 [Nonomuraea sp. NPDC055795]
MTLDQDDLVKRLARDPGPGLTPVARDLMTRIMDTAEPEPRTARVRWRPLVALPVAAALAAMGWSASALLSSEPASALAIKETADSYVIEVKDLYADSRVYERQLREAGLAISLKVVPATPSFVGEIRPDAPDWKGGSFPHADQIKTIDRQGCDLGLGRTCPIGITVAKDFTGTATLTLGREARPGEEYAIVAGLTDQGEPLHCTPFYNRRVNEVRASLAALRLSVKDYAVQNGSEVEEKDSVPDSMYVTGGSLTEYGKAGLIVSRTPMPEELVRTLLRKEGCA